MKNPDLFQFIDQSNKATTNEELTRIFREALLSIGYDQVTYNIITDHISHGLRSNYGILKECPDDWFEHYFESGYQYIDPRVKFSKIYRNAFMLNFMEDHIDLSREEKKILYELDEMSLHDGICIPIFGDIGEMSAVTISRGYRDVEPNGNTLSLIQAFVNQFHLCYLALNRETHPSIGCKVHLTPRETEILQWCACGKSNWDISAILGITENGVEYHLKNIYRKMGVSNRVSAVISAIKVGFIKL